jgi:hypothetical protein
MEGGQPVLWTETETWAEVARLAGFDGRGGYFDDEGEPVSGCPGVAVPGVDPACECADCPHSPNFESPS